MAQDYRVIQVALPVGHAYYPRPGIVVCIVSDTHKVLALSTKMDLYRRDSHFLIRKNHPDFPKTGLVEESYAIGAPVFDVDAAEIVKDIGVLTGALAVEFSKWID